MKRKMVIATKEDLKRILDEIKINNYPKSRGESKSTSIQNPNLTYVLDRHQLEVELFFDAKFREVGSIYNEMKAIGAHFAFNTIPCKYGHTFKTRNNQCIVCHPRMIEFQLRNSKDGYVYIAGSLSNRTIKVGTTIKIKGREKSLNNDSYAKINDWKILYSFYVNDSGLLEGMIHKGLEKYQILVKYEKGGKTLTSKEVFFCSFDRAYTVICNIIKERNIRIERPIFKSEISKKYQFPNLIRKK